VNAPTRSTAPEPVAAAEDGRHARRERNRLAVVDAMLALYTEGNLDPSSDEIAERAGLSPRSLFRYFDDLDDLVRVAISRQYDRMLPLARLDVSAAAPLATRVARLVSQRLGLFDTIASVGIVTRVRAPFQPLIASQLALTRTYLRRQIEQVFQPELAVRGAGALNAIAAIDVLTSFESVHLMLDDQQLTRAQIESTLVDAITRLLEA
jgi:AcrR family transcriptional regulator